MAAAVSTWVADLVATVLPTETRPAAISCPACSRERASLRRTSSASRRRRATPATFGSAPVVVRRRGRRRSRAGVERGQRVTQPPVYILVHLDVSVRGEVVGVAQPLQLSVHVRVAGGGAEHVQRGGGSRVVSGFDGDLL